MFYKKYSPMFFKRTTSVFQKNTLLGVTKTQSRVLQKYARVRGCVGSSTGFTCPHATNIELYVVLLGVMVRGGGCYVRMDPGIRKRGSRVRMTMNVGERKFPLDPVGSGDHFARADRPSPLLRAALPSDSRSSRGCFQGHTKST